MELAVCTLGVLEISEVLSLSFAPLASKWKETRVNFGRAKANGIFFSEHDVYNAHHLVLPDPSKKEAAIHRIG